MGLFSNVLHVHDVDRDRLIPALDSALAKAGFAPDRQSSVSYERFEEVICSDRPQYLISSLHGRWLTIIESQPAVHLAELGKQMSDLLNTYALALVVHDDDLFFYNLEHEGISLDGYNSCPQYFENERIGEKEIEEQRHLVTPLEPLLPPNMSLADLQSLLNRGWWNSHDQGSLDENGVAHDDDGFVFEGERMTEFGSLLQLHGHEGTYPYAAWYQSKAVHWQEFLAVQYRQRK
jgi:hypothetical protein